jgi:hypothetical protein
MALDQLRLRESSLLGGVLGQHGRSQGRAVTGCPPEITLHHLRLSE